MAAKKKSFKSVVKDAKKVLDRLSDAIEDESCKKAGKDMVQAQMLIGGLAKAARSADKSKVADLKDELHDLESDFRKACRVKVRRKKSSSTSDILDSSKYTTINVVERPLKVYYNDDPAYNTRERRKLKKYRKRKKKAAEKSTDSYLQYLARGVLRAEQDSDDSSDYAD